MTRAKCLPQSLTLELLGEWIVKNHKEKFTEEKKIYYTDEELQEFKDKAVSSGIELNNLASMKSKISKLLDSGNPEEEPMEITIPVTKGIKNLKDFRELCEKEVEKGYYQVDTKIYGIPNEETGTMDFFDIEGNETIERSRQLSVKEMRDFFGMFALPQDQKQLNQEQKQA